MADGSMLDAGGFPGLDMVVRWRQVVSPQSQPPAGWWSLLAPLDERPFIPRCSPAPAATAQVGRRQETRRCGCGGGSTHDRTSTVPNAGRKMVRRVATQRRNHWSVMRDAVMR
jgi:hypothetical protein